MGGAQEAKTTFLAPTSLAICTISLEVVPRTMESGETVNTDIVHQKIRLTIDKHNNLASKLHGHGIELSSNVLASATYISMIAKKVSGKYLPLRLPRHDESSTNITILDKPFSVRDFEVLSELQSGNSRGVGHRNHNIYSQTSFGQLLLGCLSEILPHGHSASVDTDTVDSGIGSSKVDILENVGGEDLRFGHLTARDFFAGDDDGLTGFDVLPIVET